MKRKNILFSKVQNNKIFLEKEIILNGAFEKQTNLKDKTDKLLKSTRPKSHNNKKGTDL